MVKTAFVLYSNHLVPKPPRRRGLDVFLVDDPHLAGLAGARPVAYSGLRLGYDLACCRQYLEDHPHVRWVPLAEVTPFYEETLPSYRRVEIFHPQDRDLEGWWKGWEARHTGSSLRVHPSPLFLLDEADEVSHTRPRLFDFYRHVRQQRQVLVDAQGQPEGGRWSFDEDNREAYRGDPRAIPGRPAVPEAETARWKQAMADRKRDPAFRDPRRIWPDAPEFLVPISRRGALHWLRHFVTVRLPWFGRYQDAMLLGDTTRLYHSVLSPLLNRGLLLPTEVVEAVLAARDVPLASREGFLRQVLGWREYALYVYKRVPDLSAAEWTRGRSLRAAWYEGSTGLPPLDDCIQRYWRSGYAHHIERLMLVGNMMLLCDVSPAAAYAWFMEVSLDAYPWVMDLNVCMILFRKGVTTKPYASSSKYIRKQSNVPPGTWTRAWDALYTAYILRNKESLRRVRNMPMIIRVMERLAPDETKARLQLAESVRHQLTHSST